jgi:hypothetical protein
MSREKWPGFEPGTAIAVHIKDPYPRAPQPPLKRIYLKTLSDVPTIVSTKVLKN